MRPAINLTSLSKWIIKHPIQMKKKKCAEKFLYFPSRDVIIQAVKNLKQIKKHREKDSLCQKILWAVSKKRLGNFADLKFH